MEKESFEELLESARQAAAILRGDAPPSRQFTFTSADVKAIRQRLGLSQRTFAMLLGVSTDTVQTGNKTVASPEAQHACCCLLPNDILKSLPKWLKKSRNRHNPDPHKKQHDEQPCYFRF